MKINWNLDLKLSLLGLFMALGTVFFIPFKIEPFCWLIIFCIIAYFVAKNCEAYYFQNGVVIGLLNSVWVTAAHVLFFGAYTENHIQETMSMSKFPLNPKLMMLITGPIIGLISGLVIGLFCYIASLILKKPANKAVNS